MVWNWNIWSNFEILEALILVSGISVVLQCEACTQNMCEDKFEHCGNSQENGGPKAPKKTVVGWEESWEEKEECLLQAHAPVAWNMNCLPVQKPRELV